MSSNRNSKKSVFRLAGQFRSTPSASPSVAVLEGPDRKQAERLRSLDAWRGICALFVAALHFQTTGYIHSSALVGQAGRFVDFFFVLSGFVIARAYRRRLEEGAWGPFMIRRVGRLWPLHLVTLAGTVAMAAAGSFIGLTVNGFVYADIPANITMTHAWGYLDRLTWNGPSWSISTEMFAYLTFAFLAWRLRSWRLDVACMVVLAVSLHIVMFTAPSGFGSSYDFGVERCLFGFMAGVLGDRLWHVTSIRPRGELFALLLAFLSVAFLPDSLSVLLIPIFVWTVLVFASDAGPVSRILHTAFPQLLGRVSYSLYMTHYIIGLTIITVLALFTNLTSEVSGNRTIVAYWWICDGLTLLYLAIVIGVSCLTYGWIERPGRAWFNDRANPVPAAW
jgi:peptidoglycan/LPS O-acetylase OafA/YrhL